MSRELTREEKRKIRALVTKWCANYDKEYGCLPLECECYMFGKCWTGAYCRYFREAVLPLDPALEAALMSEGPPPEFKPCPVCGGPSPWMGGWPTARRLVQRKPTAASNGNICRRNGAVMLTIRPSKTRLYQGFPGRFWGRPCVSMACPCFAEMLSTSAPPLLDTLSRGGGHIQGGVILEENQGYVIRRTILFDNKCGFVLGENPKAPNPYVTWQFNEQDGHRDYFWGHYHNEPDMAERDLHNRAEDYQRRYYVFEVEQAPDKETYKYYSTQRPIDIGTYPKSDFNRPVHMDIYPTRQQVPGEAFQAWGAITYAQPLTEQEMRDYELRPARDNLDIRRQMDAQAQVVGKWEDAHHVPEQRRLTWFYHDFGCYVAKEYVTPEQLTTRVRSVERQAAARAHKQEKGKQPIAEQLKAAQREAQAGRGQDTLKRSAPDRGER